jgi:hypothetical protein
MFCILNFYFKTRFLCIETRTKGAEARLHHSLFEILSLEELPSLVSLSRCSVSKSKKHFIFEKKYFIIKYENVQHLRKSLNPWRAETRLFRVSALDSLIFPYQPCPHVLF